MHHSAWSPRRSSPGYDVKASSLGDAPSSDGVLLDAGSSPDYGKPLRTTDDGPSDVHVPHQAVPGLQDPSTQNSKRKTIHNPLGFEDTEYGQGISKKLKFRARENQPSHLPRNKAHLPSEIWHRIFAFTPPRGLGALLQVNKLFNGYLVPQSPFGNSTSLSEYPHCIKPLRPDTIWQLSRRLHWPRMPAPLRDRSELDMWRLCCTKVCQRCGVAKASQQRQESPGPWHLGPGLDGLAAIFVFGVTYCGPCLLQNSVKEIDLLLSSTTPSLLIPALAYVFVTNELQVVPPSAMASIANTSKTETIKLYSASSITTAKEELHAIQNLGTAAVEEWLKGLDARGKEHRTDASRWEKWAVAGGLAMMSRSLQLQLSGDSNESAEAPAPKLSDFVRDSPGVLCSVADQEFQMGKPLPITSLSPGRQLDSPAITDKSHEHQGRLERTCEEAAALKALRRVEIERRAMLIDPPLPPNLLVHMPSFQAAIQITAPLDDNAWSTLMPRLLAQRANAEKAENKTQAKGASTSFEKNDSSPKEVTDKDWDDIQGPVRTRMSNYADDIIRNTWGKGRKVNKENSPRFAAEVLLSVRARFYADVAQDAADAIAAGQQPVADPPEGPFTQKLTLENMKWVFDMKIKQHTESNRKELFLCNGCDSNKFYGFEGVIQHYAAKHTKALSLGNVVVHWRAEWPQQSPFKPNARPTKHSHQNLPHVPQSHAAAGQPQYRGYDVLYQSGNMAPVPSYQFLAKQAPPTSFAPKPADSYLPPPSYHVGSGMPPAPYQTSAYGVNGVSQTYPPAPMGFGPYFSPTGPPEYPPSMPGPPYPGQPHHAASIQGQGNLQLPYSAARGMPLSPSYHAQIEDLARSARDLWNTLSSVRDLPGPLRVYVAIHHVVNRFRSKFSEAPSLRMFNDGLSNNKEMRPVRNVNGLMCKSCALRLGPSVNPDRKTFSLPQLVNHFENRHLGFPKVDYRGQPATDWTQDMVLLPDVSEMPDLRTILGNKGHKFNLINEAVPWVFNKPNKSSHRPQAAWPPNDDPMPGGPHQPVEYDRHSLAYPPAGNGDTHTNWPDPLSTRGTTYATRGQDIQRQPIPFGYEDRITAFPHEPVFDSHQARDMRLQLDPPLLDAYRPGTLDAPSRGYDPPGDSVHYERMCPEGIGITRHHNTPAFGSDRPYDIGDEGRHVTREQPRASGHSLAKSISEQDGRYCPEGGLRVAHPFDRAGSVGPRPGLGRSRMTSQDTFLGIAGGMSRAPRTESVFIPISMGPSPDEPDGFNLTAALESHLAQDRDVPIQKHKDEPMVPETRRQVRRNAAQGFHQPTYHGYQQECIEAADDDAWQDRFSRRPREPFENHHHGGSYDTVCIQSSTAVKAPDRARNRRQAVHTYTDEMRPSPVQYEQAYEIVHVRDAEGEYVIRRPILREREQLRIHYKDDRHVRPDQESYPPTYGAAYDSAGRDGNPGERSAPTRMREATSIPPWTKTDSSLYEEYDPRNPAPVPGPSTARDLSH